MKNIFSVAISCACLLMSLFSCRSYADGIQTALLISVEGKVEILTPLVGNTKPAGPQMTFEGEKYSFQNGKVGLKLISGQVVLSSTNGKAKVIYSHGDVILVGPSTSIVIPVVKGTEKELSLNYGKVRGVINKDGPLAGLKIRTPSAVAGVRGTDLFVSYNPTDVRTEVQVLRGEVEVKAQIQVTENLSQKTIDAIESKTYTVKTHEKLTMDVVEHTQSVATSAGANSAAAATEAAVQAPTVSTELVRSSLEDLDRVKNRTTLVAQNSAEIPAGLRGEVAAAEKRALENVMDDVRKYDVSAADAMKANKVASVDEANMQVVNQLADTAEKKAEETPVEYKKNNYNIYLGILNDGPRLGASIQIKEFGSFELRAMMGAIQRRMYFGYPGTGNNFSGADFYQSYGELILAAKKHFARRHALFLLVGADVPFGSTKLGGNSNNYPLPGDISSLGTMQFGYEFRISQSFSFGVGAEAHTRGTNNEKIDQGNTDLRGGGFFVSYIF